MAAELITLTPVTLSNSSATPIKSTTTVCSSVIFTADSNNTGNIYYGASNVSSTNGKPMAAGDELQIGYDQVFGTNGKIDLSNVYFASDNNGNAVRVTYIKWTSF